MNGKTVVITGATSGIGEVAADRLAAKGARIVFVARDQKRGEETLKHLNAIAPGAGTQGLLRRSVAPFGNEARGGGDRCGRTSDRRADQQCGRGLHDARSDRRRPREDLRAQSHVLFRADGIAAAADRRRRTHRFDGIDRASRQASRFRRSAVGEALFGLRGLWPLEALQHPLHARIGAAARRHRHHRELPASGFRRHALRQQQWRRDRRSVFGLAKNFALSPEQGASTIIYLASSPDVENTTGLYFDKCKPATPSREAQNDADAKRLWDVSAKIAGLGA